MCCLPGIKAGFLGENSCKEAGRDGEMQVSYSICGKALSPAELYRTELDGEVIAAVCRRVRRRVRGK